MIINNSFIPKFICNDLSYSDTKVQLNIGWEIISNTKYLVEIFHEKNGFIKFNKHSSEFYFVKELLSNKPIHIGNYSRDIILNLWLKGLFHIFYKENIKIPERYKYFFETLIRYSGIELTPYKMLSNLHRSKVVIIGAGGIGSNISVLISAHGVGHITLIDGDTVEESNLNRQIFYKFKDIGQYKVDILGKHIIDNNPDTKVNCIKEFITSYEKAYNFIKAHDFVILCADEPRFKIQAWIGKACFEQNIPLLFMANKWIGPILIKNKSPCYACLGRYHLSKQPNINLALSLDNSHLPPRASFGPEPFIASGYMSSLIILFLTGIDRETFLEKRFEFSSFGIGVEEKIPRYIDCKICHSD
ncbi:ThiF family adenylyltransferase [Muribacter muris]|nr:ThiF family adenylyltransferase [Muribacter muris]MBF0784770.1 ThiF family adenylyltransferase [Muribacter muris]MBF0827783.1 ThiF family adenylyltransferase [Muribacter muris]